jgi:hypothetical protein
MIDGIHFGDQVLVLGVWQGATENTTVVKGLLKIWSIEDWI